MNERDREELIKRWDENPRFRTLFNELVSLQVKMKLQNLAALTAQVPKAHELKEGKQTKLFLASNPGQSPSVVMSEAGTYIQQVEHLAHRLSTFFPERRRYHWQEVFLALAFGGTGRVEQRQRGGRPRGVSEKKAEEYRALAEWYHKTDLTQREFCEEADVSRSKLQRALKFVSENGP